MLTAKQIEKDAKQFIQNNPPEKEKIDSLLANEADLFEYFLNCVKENKPLIVSYILNGCFNDANKRANFGNQQDEAGNSAYHYAAERGCDDIVIILNDKRKFHDKIKYFSFILKNKDEKTPLDLCCEQANLSTFKIIWERAGKSNHNPMYALHSACIGGNSEIINSFLTHPKFDPTEAAVSTVYNAALEGTFGEKVKQIFIAKKVCKIKIDKAKRQSTEGLKQNNLFAEIERKQPVNKKARLSSIESPTSDLSTVTAKSLPSP